MLKSDLPYTLMPSLLLTSIIAISFQVYAASTGDGHLPLSLITCFTLLSSLPYKSLKLFI
jgi:hypothetical protein